MLSPKCVKRVVKKIITLFNITVVEMEYIFFKKLKTENMSLSIIVVLVLGVGQQEKTL